MNSESMKNMVVIKNLPSNIIEEAIVILKPNIKLKNLDLSENKKLGDRVTKNDNVDNPKKYVVNEAEMVISNYLSNIEKEKKNNIKTNRKIENKYRRLRAVCVFLGVLLTISFLIR